MENYYKIFTKCINSENYYYYLIQTSEKFSDIQLKKIKDLINNNPNERILVNYEMSNVLLEPQIITIIGPKMYMRSVFDTNFTNILSRLSINQVSRCERYKIIPHKNVNLEQYDMMVYSIQDLDHMLVVLLLLVL